ncbi:MAG: glycosyltransferase family 2 protein [Chitinophagaceae bacterium]|nr:glycosyltransferase family 2 protein [Chitinophagaceae bacterium]MCW5905301.1 glycosyltransferase family 2 protein [Chitinophagaceae bacterium]
MSLSIIIVNYKSAPFIIDCLQSAVKFSSYQNFEWIIVDNNSNDNSKENIMGKFPFIKWIDMAYNAGFSRANNAGIKIATGNAVLLLNPDTLIVDDAIEKCYNQFIKSHYVACGVQMLNPDNTTQISGSNFMKGGINHLLPLPYLGSFLKIIAKGMKVSKPSIEVASNEEIVQWISGAFLMVKKEAIEKIGMMDEDFFLYAEEIEWCSRLNTVGKLCVYGQYHIIHILGEVIVSAADSKDKSYQNLFDKKGLQLIVSNHLRIKKQYGYFWFFVQLIAYTIEVPIFFIGLLIDNIVHLRNPFKNFTLFTGYTNNVISVWKLLPKFMSNKSYFFKVF